MIRFEQVGKRYPNGHVGLHELSFQVRRGEFLFVTGHSGAGKSTLLRLLLAMERPTSGKLLLAGQDLSRITNAQIPFCADRSAWCSRTTSCCSIAPYSTTSPCRCRSSG